MIDVKKMLKSFSYAFEGIMLALSLDQNMRFHAVVGLIVLVLSVLLPLSVNEFLIVVLAVFFVWFAELTNTAVEEMTNLIIKEHRREAKIAKDVAAAAVLLAAFFSVIVGFVILLPKILAIF